MRTIISSAVSCLKKVSGWNNPECCKCLPALAVFTIHWAIICCPAYCQDFSAGAGRFNEMRIQATAASQLDSAWKTFETSYHENTEPLRINVTDFVQPNGLNDATKAIQDAIDSAPQGSQIYFPQGVYLVNNLSIGDRQVLGIVSRGATLRATEDAECILNVGSNIQRHVPLHIKGLRFDGSLARKGAVGIRVSDRLTKSTYSQIRTNLHISDCSVWKCKTGIDLHATLNCHIQDTVCSQSEVGIKVRQTHNGGCGNANLFTNVELYANTIGMIMSGKGSRFGMSNNVFTGGTIQASKVCGLAMFDTKNAVFVGTHFERNTGKAKLTSIAIENSNDYIDRKNPEKGIVKQTEMVTVKRANIYLNDAEFKAVSPGFSTPDDPNILMEREARAYLMSPTGYGNSQGAWTKDLDGSCRIFCDGPTLANGTSTAVAYQSPSEISFNVRFAYLTVPVIETDESIENLMMTPNAPKFEKSRGLVKTNVSRADPVWGEVNTCTFSPKKGSTQINRVVVDTGIGVFNKGDLAVVSFLAKSGSETQGTIRFELTDGTFSFISVPLTNKWVRVVMLARAHATYSPSLYVFPEDDHGVELQLAKMMVHKVSAGEDNDIISRIATEYIYCPNTQGIQICGDEDVSLNTNSKRTQLFAAKLTGNRTVVMPATALDGEKFRIRRSAAGAGKLEIVHEKQVLTTLSDGGWVGLEYTNGNWYIIEDGQRGNNATTSADPFQKRQPMTSQAAQIMAGIQRPVPNSRLLLR